MTKIDTSRPVYLAMDTNYGGGEKDHQIFDLVTNKIKEAGFTIARRMLSPNGCGQMWTYMDNHNIKGATLVFFVNGIDAVVLRTGFKHKKWDYIAHRVRNRDNDFCLIGFETCCDWVHETGRCYNHIKDMHDDYPNAGAIANEMYHPLKEAIAGEVKCACVTGDQGPLAAQEFIKFYEVQDTPSNIVVDNTPTTTEEQKTEEEVITVRPGVIVPRYKKMFTVTTDSNGVIQKQIELPYKCKYHISLYFPGSIEYAHSSTQIEIINNNGEYYQPTEAEIQEYVQRHSTKSNATAELIDQTNTNTDNTIKTGSNKDPWSVDIPTLATGVPNVAAMDERYVLADEEATYTITYGQAKEVMMQDAKCIQLFGRVSKYVAFPTTDQPNKFQVIRREKWNIIERNIHLTLVKAKGGNVPDTQIFTVDLKGKAGNYVNIRDSQDTKYTCGPTSLSACTQALHMYVSEQTLQNTIKAVFSLGSGPDQIARGARNYNMTPKIVATSGWSNKAEHLQKGLPLVYHVSGHYVAIIDISDDGSKVLVSNSSGGSDGSHGIITGWNSSNTIARKAYGACVLVSPNYTISESGKIALNHYWNSMGGSWKRTQNLNEAIPL